MKKLLAYSLLSSSIFLSADLVKADWDTYGVNSFDSSDNSLDGFNIYGINSSAGTRTLLKFLSDPNFTLGIAPDGASVDSKTGDLILKRGNNTYTRYSIQDNEFTSNSIWNGYQAVLKRPDYSGETGDCFTSGTTNLCKDGIYDKTGGESVLIKNADGSIQIGADSDDIDVVSDGLTIDGEPLITKKSNGELHIGKNSWITKEENGRQKVYAKDANGNPIPIDYTNGTKLLINGRDVEQSINNVGALSAALTGLPTVPTDTTLACGLGTGTHGGDFALSGGCASKVNEKLSINYAASMTMPGQDYAGDFEDTFSARAGFVWKLGKATKPTQISMNEKKVFETKIKTLEDKNNQLLARLEKLEKLAFKDLNAKDLAVYKLK